MSFPVVEARKRVCVESLPSLTPHGVIGRHARLSARSEIMALKIPDAPADNFLPGEVLYRLLFENGLDGLMLTSPDGTILDANPAACSILGRTREEILQEGRNGVMDNSDPRLQEMILQRQRTGRAHGEANARRKDSSTFPVELSSVVFRDPAGQFKTCIIMRDITDRKAADAERERLIQELQEALARVKTLSGLLPVCASCRKIRDKQGAWHSLETYIRTHTEADFSHGICPDCRRKLYPESL
jgi:PAS domain S-box-containing protein